MPGRARRPVITLTTDFGLADAYVAQMKAVIARVCRDANVIDVTHLIPRHDILAGSIALERIISGSDDGTIHIAVVDPGVGSDRKLLVANIAGQTVLCPDNGLITWAMRRHGYEEVRELTYGSGGASAAFHGRDILAPVAALLAINPRSVIDGTSRVKMLRTGGTPISRSKIIGSKVEPILLDIDVSLKKAGVVIHVDVYGNATTNIVPGVVGDARVVTIGRRKFPILRTYSDVPKGKPLALIGSSDLLEIAVNQGSAADVLRVRVGDKVTLQ